MSHIIKNKLLLFLLYISLVIGACTTHPTDSIKPPPPPAPPAISFNEQCDKLKKSTYNTLMVDGADIIFNDTIHHASKAFILDEVLHYNFNLNHSNIIDSVFFPDCVMPIMDSVIEKRYGINGKDSIIDLAYKITDSIYKDRIERGLLEEE